MYVFLRLAPRVVRLQPGFELYVLSKHDIFPRGVVEASQSTCGESYMTKSQISFLGSLLAAGALAAAGCGGGSSSSGTGGATGGGGRGTGGATTVGTGGAVGTGGHADAGTPTDVPADTVTPTDTGSTDTTPTDVASEAATDSAPVNPLIPVGTFNTDLDGFSLLYVTPTLQPEVGAQATAEFDATVGKPNPGSAKLTLPFFPMTPFVDEHVEFGKNFTPVDMTGRIITARVMLDAVDGSASPGVQAYFVIKTATATNANAYRYGNGGYTNLSAGNWVTVIMPIDGLNFTDTGWDVTRVQQVTVGIQGDSTNTGLTAATVHIDTIGYQ
jgi:hypothetical protein